MNKLPTYNYWKFNTRKELEETIDVQLNKLLKPGTIGMTIYQHMLSDQGLKFLRLDSCSKHIEIPRRSLQRYLRAEGVRYELIRDLARYTLTVRQLCNRKTLIRYWVELGFVEHTSMTACCLRWFGKTPTELNKLALTLQ